MGDCDRDPVGSSPGVRGDKRSLAVTRSESVRCSPSGPGRVPALLESLRGRSSATAGCFQQRELRRASRNRDALLQSRVGRALLHSRPLHWRRRSAGDPSTRSSVLPPEPPPARKARGTVHAGRRKEQRSDLRGISIREPDAPRYSWNSRIHFQARSEEHTSELQSHVNLVCRLLLEKKNKTRRTRLTHREMKTKTVRRNNADLL